MKNFTEILNGSLGYQAQLIALSKINFKAGTEIAKSKLIQPKKSVSNPSIDKISLDDFRDLALPEEFAQVQENDETQNRDLFQKCVSAMNSTICLAQDILKNEPANKWLSESIKSPIVRIIERANYMRENDSYKQQHQANLKTLSAFGTTEGVENLEESSKARAVEMVKNSIQEFSSFDNMEEIKNLETSELLALVENLNSDEMLEQFNNSVLNLCSKYAQNPRFNVDPELLVYGNELKLAEKS